MSPLFVVTLADGPPKEHTLAGRVIRLGRAPENELPLPGDENGASRVHAHLERIGEVWYVFDHDSRNGTFLNNQRLEPFVSRSIGETGTIVIGKWTIECRLPRASASSITGTVDVAPPRQAHGVTMAYQAVLSVPGSGPPFTATVAVPSPVGAAPPAPPPAPLPGSLPVPAAAPAPTPSPPVPPPSTSAPAPADAPAAVREASHAALRSLLASLTHGQDFDDVAMVERFRTLLQQTLELTSEWLLNSVNGRKVFEERFGAKITKFFGLELNPIKHALTPEQVSTYLLKPTTDRDPEKIRGHLSDAFRDLAAHQLGLMAGFQAALKAAVEQLSPAAHEAAAAAEVPAFPPWSRDQRVRSAAWDRYAKAYEGLFDNESKLWNEVIYPNVRKGYLVAHGEQEGIGKDGPARPPGPVGT